MKACTSQIHKWLPGFAPRERRLRNFKGNEEGYVPRFHLIKVNICREWKADELIVWVFFGTVQKRNLMQGTRTELFFMRFCWLPKSPLSDWLETQICVTWQHMDCDQGCISVQGRHCFKAGTLTLTLLCWLAFLGAPKWDSLAFSIFPGTNPIQSCWLTLKVTFLQH